MAGKVRACYARSKRSEWRGIAVPVKRNRAVTRMRCPIQEMRQAETPANLS